MERETGIEPATNSLEGCDSTTELLPPSVLASNASSHLGGLARLALAHFAISKNRSVKTASNIRHPEGWPAIRSSPSIMRAKDGGQGRIRTFVATRTTDLQSVAIDRSATCPLVFLGCPCSVPLNYCQ